MMTMLRSMIQPVMQRTFGDERGAEMVEWVLWVGGIAVVVVAVTTAISTPIQTRIIAIINALPTAAS